MEEDTVDFATDAELRKALREPFPPELISIVDKGFGPIDTINHAVVTDRLNQVAPGWTWEPVDWVKVDGTDGMPHLLAVIGKMTIGGITRYEVGEVEKPSTFGDETKKAVSDFIKRGAMRFGVALDLWSKEDLLYSGAESLSASEGAATATGNDRLGKAVEATTVAAPLRAGESTEGAQAIGQAAQDAASPAPVNGSSPYLTAEEGKVLAKVYGGQKALLDAARSRYGERIRRTLDITREQGQVLANDLLAKVEHEEPGDGHA